MYSRERVIAPGLSFNFRGTVTGTEVGSPSLSAPRAIAESEGQREMTSASLPAVGTATRSASPWTMRHCDASLFNFPCSSRNIRFDMSGSTPHFLTSVISALMLAPAASSVGQQADDPSP